MSNLNQVIYRQAGNVRLAERAEGGETENRTVTGKAVVYGNKQEIYGWYDEEMQAGCFGDTVKDDKVRALWQHKRDKVLGANRNDTLRLEDKPDGLYFAVDLPKTMQGDEALELIRRGDVHECSFGAYITDEEYGKKDDKYYALITGATLLEISFVTWPAYTGTSVDVSAALALPGMIREDERREMIIRGLAAPITPTTEADRALFERLDKIAFQPIHA